MYKPGATIGLLLEPLHGTVKDNGSPPDQPSTVCPVCKRTIREAEGNSKWQARMPYNVSNCGKPGCIDMLCRLIIIKEVLYLLILISFKTGFFV